ncbi:hypothetical protein NDU88_000185 [Pleurodeles waltl]|uniref:Uncharacterized protein n=1 Tax=Pleurodeles waltl TaxID=8319 RepID=A0AAV7KUY4_PLEWA|nr:hypothetical protein NDU88_000185 [Pleurodeles waltl]
MLCKRRAIMRLSFHDKARHLPYEGPRILFSECSRGSEDRSCRHGVGAGRVWVQAHSEGDVVLFLCRRPRTCVGRNRSFFRSACRVVFPPLIPLFLPYIIMAYYANEEEQYHELQEMPIEHQMEERLV